MIVQISPLGKHLPKAWGGCAEPYPQGSFGRNGQRPTQHWCPVRDGKSDALRWGVFAAPFFDAHRVQACYRSGDPLSAAQPSLQCGRDAAGLVVSDGAGSGANRDDSTAATERCLSVFDRAALLSGSLHDAPLSVASGPAGPVATAQAARPVLEPHAGSPPHTDAFDFRLGLDGLGALRAARERSRRLQPEQAGASFLLPTAVFRSPDPRLLARRVAARRCGHAARRAGMRTGLLPQNPAEGPTRDFARRQRVFRSQADRLGGGARRRLCDRGPAHSAHPAPAERAALPSLGVGRRDCHVSLSAPRLDTAGTLRGDSTPATGRFQRTTAIVSTRSLSLPSPRHQSALAAAQSLALLQSASRGRIDHQAAQSRLRLGAHPHSPLHGQRNLLSSVAAGLQPDELVQATLPTTRVSGRNAAKPAPQNPVDASATATHSQPSKSCSARPAGPGSSLGNSHSTKSSNSKPDTMLFHAGFRFICGCKWFYEVSYGGPARKVLRP